MTREMYKWQSENVKKKTEDMERIFKSREKHADKADECRMALMRGGKADERS